MNSVTNSLFIMKYKFHKKYIQQYARVKLITIISNSCLIEDITTFKRIWVSKTDIYPLTNHDLYGHWKYCKITQKIANKKCL
jgi:hypothetical protein